MQQTIQDKYPSACCGHLVFTKKPGSHDICPICFWHDDVWGLRFPLTGGGANRPSLAESQRNYQAIGAKEERVVPYVRPPDPDEPRDPAWRPIDPVEDDPERPLRGMEYGRTYPKDRTQLYYWRSTYWRWREPA